MHGTILCGVTETPEARAAAQLCAALASRLDLRLVLVHVLTGAHGPDAFAAETERRLEQFAHQLGDRAEIRVVRGSRVDELARVAADEGADVIVLGSRPRGARSRQLRCGLACELESAQAVPVLIAPPATRPRSRRRLALADTAAER